MDRPGEDTTFTFNELRILLTAFAMWLKTVDGIDMGDDLPVELVARFIEEA